MRAAGVEFTDATSSCENGLGRVKAEKGQTLSDSEDRPRHGVQSDMKEDPPIGSWAYWYLAVLLLLAFLIVLFHLFTERFR